MKPIAELPKVNMADKLAEAQTQLDEHPFTGAAPLLVEHPLTKIVSGFFEVLGQDPADLWVAGSQVKAIGGINEIRALVNNELRRILSVMELTGKGQSFDMRFLLNRDPDLETWLQSLYQYVCPFIVSNSLLELPEQPASSSPDHAATITE